MAKCGVLENLLVKVGRSGVGAGAGCVGLGLVVLRVVGFGWAAAVGTAAAAEPFRINSTQSN